MLLWGQQIVDENKLILLAEDFPDDAGIIKTVLKRAGVMNPVFVVSDGTEAVAYLRGDDPYADRSKFPLPAVLLLDLKMPKMDGFQVLEWCKTQAQLKQMLVVVLSGYGELKLVNRAYTLGAHTFLLKPCTHEDIALLTSNFTGYWNFPQAV